MNRQARRKTDMVALAILVLLTNAGIVAQRVPDDTATPRFDISGKVSDSAGQPLPDVSVVLKSSLGSVVRTTETDNDGRYHFQCIPSDKYTVVFSLRGFLTQEQQGVKFSYPDSLILSPVMTISPEFGETFVNLLTIRLFVISATDGKPIQGAQVTVDNVKAAVVDECGRGAIFVRPGQHRIRVTKPGRASFEEMVSALTEDVDLKVTLKEER
jgi:hypothetical protein